MLIHVVFIMLYWEVFYSKAQDFAHHNLFLLGDPKFRSTHFVFARETQIFAPHTLFSLEKHKYSLSTPYFRSKNTNIRSAHFIFTHHSFKAQSSSNNKQWYINKYP